MSLKSLTLNVNWMRRCVCSGVRAVSITQPQTDIYFEQNLLCFDKMSAQKQRVSINYKSHWSTMTLMQEEVKNAKGDIWDVLQWKQPQRKECVPLCVCVCKIRGMLQRFKVPITAECSSDGISGTRRAQMAPKSSESFWKGHTKYKRTIPTYSPTHTLLLTDSSGLFLRGLLVPHQSSESSTIIFFFQVGNREPYRNAFKMSSGGGPDSRCHWWDGGKGWIQ